MFGICNLAIIPLRIEPSDRSEIVSQVLFGEHFEILDQLKQWSKIRLQFDNYEGWVDSKQYQIISESEFNVFEILPNEFRVINPIAMNSMIMIFLVFICLCFKFEI